MAFYKYLMAHNKKNTNTNMEKTIVDWISDLKLNWKPEKKTESGYGYHGSSKGDYIEYELYFDEFRCEWTDKDRAFQGYVFKNITSILKGY